MKSQFDHELLSSFYLWFDDALVRRNDSYIEQPTGLDFVQKVAGTSEEADDIPPNLDAFYAPFRQLVGEGVDVSSGVYFNGALYNQGTKGVLIDFNEARVMVEAGLFPSGTSVTGAFNTKEVNVYITNDSEEDLVMNNDFLVDDYGNTYLQDKGDLSSKKYTLPAAFISYNASQNLPRALGGLEDTQAAIRVVAIVEDNYTLDGMVSIFRDSARETFPLIPYQDFPYGEFFHIKNPPYTYTGLVAQSQSNPQMYIESTNASKLFDRTNRTIPIGVRIGFLDFNVSNFRYPRL